MPITKITIPKSLKNFVYTDSSIYDYNQSAFEGCESLKQVVFEQGVTEVINNLFTCTYLEEITIPNTVTTIGKNAFVECSMLANVVLPKTITSIGSNAFYHCTSLKEISIPKSTSTIGSQAFASSGLTSIVLPTAVTNISNVFNSCSDLSSVTLSKRTTNISGAFKNCTALESITLPATITDAASAFSGSGLKNVTFEDGFSAIPNSMFSNADKLENITIPDTVTKIESSAFYDCDALTEISIPDSVQSLGSSAFSGCDNLQKVVLGNGITALNEQTFYKDTKLSDVKLPNKLKTISSDVFYNCDALKKIELPETLYRISSRAFYDCDSLESIDLSNVSDIYSEAFRDCDSLASVNFGSYISSIGESAFRKLPMLTEVRIPSPIATLSNYAFAENVALENAYIPSSVTTINDYAFSYPDIMTIHGVKGSAAETYADYWEYAFVPEEENSASVKPTATEILDKSVKLSWTAVDGAEKYAVCVLDSNGVMTVIDDSVTGTEYTVTGLSPYTAYNFTVRSYKNGKLSVVDKEAYLSVRTAKSAADPTNFTAEASDRSVTLSWARCSSGGYYIYRFYNNEWNKIADIPSYGTTSYIVKDLEPDTEYRFGIAHFYVSNGSTIISNIIDTACRTLEAKTLAVPVIESAESENGSVVLTWGAVDGADNYEVYRSDSESGTKNLITSTASLSYSDADVEGGKTYYYYVVAVDTSADVRSDYSAPVSCSVEQELKLDLPVFTVKAGDGCVTIEWNEVDNALLYSIYRITDGVYVKVYENDSPDSFVEYDLENGVTYGYIVVAVNGNITSEYTDDDIVYVTPKAHEVDPTKPVVTAEPTYGGAVVTWEPVEGAIKYRVFTFVPGQKIRQFGSDTKGTSMTVKGLKGGEKTGIIVLAQFANKKWSSYTDDDIVYVIPYDAVKPYLCVNPKENGQVYLIWSSVPTSVRYKVMVREKGGDWYLAAATRQRCRVTLDGLDPNTEYEFLVRGLNARNKYTPMDADDIVSGSPLS